MGLFPASAAGNALEPSADTAPELELRRILHGLGLRYRVHLPLPFDHRRRADIAFTRIRLAIFVDGCFWHGCPTHDVPPATHERYWDAKVRRNRERDLETSQRLQECGWTVLRFWEHELPAQSALVIRQTVFDLRGARGGTLAGQSEGTEGIHQAEATVVRHPGTRGG